MIIVAAMGNIPVQGQQAFERYQYNPSHNNYFGVLLSYSQLYFSDHFYFSTTSEYLFDDKNDRYEAQGLNNWAAGASYMYFIGEKKLFSLGLNVYYATRMAEMAATSKYLVRDPVSLDTVDLLIYSNITTNFNSVFAEGMANVRLELSKSIYAFSGVGIMVGYALGKNDATYEADILGMIKPGETDLVPTSLTFNNGSKHIEIQSSESDVFRSSVEGESIQFGIKVAFGMEFIISDRFMIRAETSGIGELMRYFKEQDSGVMSSAFFTASVMYAL